MFYCPKCRRTYEDGSQRFCSNDGGRLLPALSSTAKTAEGKKGVFSTLLTKAPKRSEADETLAPVPKFIKVEQTIQPDFPPLAPGEISKPKPETKLEFEPKPKAETKPAAQPKPAEKIKPAPEKKPAAEAKPTIEIKPLAEMKPPPVQPKTPTEIKAATETKSETKPTTETKPAARLVKPSEIASGTASVGDRSVNPTGRLAISWEKPNALLGQTVKGRYQVTEKIGQDETSISYLAQDKLSPEKKVVVRVLMEEDAEDLASRIFAEERVSLSHLNHPNVAGLIDSGELLEGKPFIISEYVTGKSVKDKLQQTGQFNALRAARIVRQAAYALSEVHQNGVLHRNLKPENIILTVNEAGTEQVKVTDFAVSDGRQITGNPAYKSPEQLEGKMPSFASDIYSLAVIAYQMLTNRLPFGANSINDLIAAQKKGLNLKTSNLRLDLPSQLDEILGKALAYKPSERYPKARDFGDAFFNALAIADAPAPKRAEETEKTSEAAVAVMPPISADTPLDGVEIELIDDEPEKNAFVAVETPVEEKAEKIEAKDDAKAETKDLPPEKRSAETVKSSGKSSAIFWILGLVALGAGLWAIWYFAARQNQLVSTPANQVATGQNSNAPVENTATNTAPPQSEIELPPAARTVLPPPNSVHFQNTRNNLKGELASYYRGFSFYYPKDWTKTSDENNFVDVARKTDEGIPIEQMLVSFYKSKGTFKDDREGFPEMVRKTNEQLEKNLKNYRFVSEGEKTIGGGWKVYEMKFEGTIEPQKGESTKIFGRRLFMPAMRQGIKSGFMITLLATPLSPNVQTVEDVGEKGELRTILETFEPSQLY